MPNMWLATVTAALLLASLASVADGSLDFFMDAEQAERLYGVDTAAKGIYYIRGGIVNQYAMTFPDQVSCFLAWTEATLMTCTLREPLKRCSLIWHCKKTHEDRINGQRLHASLTLTTV